MIFRDCTWNKKHQASFLEGVGVTCYAAVLQCKVLYNCGKWTQVSKKLFAEKCKISLLKTEQPRAVTTPVIAGEIPML